MSFKHPEILYALLLLLIPIIIHLVRWKKFKQELFTNVAFLQDLEIKSRKSRMLKELIVLALRLLALAMLVIAFAQPYFASKASQQHIKQDQTIIYVDNSLSMRLINENTSLMQDVIQALNKYLDDDKTYSLLTNTKSYQHITGKEVKKKLYKIPFTPKSTQHSQILKRIRLLFDKQAGLQRNVLYISDMQNVEDERLTPDLFDKDIHYYFYKNSLSKVANISIDSLWITGEDDAYYYLKLALQSNNKQLQAPVNIRRNNELLWQGSVNFADSLRQEIKVQISKNKDIEARVNINDRGFRFDNDLYFTIHKPDKIKILVVGDKMPDYLKKIYTDDEFALDLTQANQVNYSRLNQYDLLVLAHLKHYDNISADAINKYVNHYGNILIIPVDNQADTLQNMLTKLHIRSSLTSDTSKVFLNKINFAHPLFKGVFLKKINNFAYPYVKHHYHFGNQGSWLYQLSDHSDFARMYERKGKIFVINNSLQTQNTSFTEAPALIVPLLYQIGRAKQAHPTLYYVLGQKNSFAVNATLSKDETLKMQNGDRTFIPYQINRFNNVLIQTDALPTQSGIYNILEKERKISSVAYNYNRNENKLTFLDIPAFDNVETIKSIDDFKQQQATFFKEQSNWKWFLVFALVFLLLEMLVIRYFK